MKVEDLTFMFRMRKGWMEAGVVGEKGAVHSWQRWSPMREGLHDGEWCGGLEFHYRLADGEKAKPGCGEIDNCRYFDGGRCATTGSSLAYSNGPWRSCWPQCEPEDVRLSDINMRSLKLHLELAYAEYFSEEPE